MADSIRQPAEPGYLRLNVTTRPPMGAMRPEGLADVEGQAQRAAGAIRAPHPIAGSRNLGDRIFSLLTTGFAGVVLGSLVLIIVVLLHGAWPSIVKFGTSFVSTATWDTGRDVYGVEPAIVGTVYSSFLALLLAAPFGLLVAIFLAEVAPLRVRTSLGFVVELLAAVPSIVYGLWALFVLVPLVRDHLEQPLSSAFGNTPFFSGFPYGLGMMPAAIILAIMVLPTIASISRDVMRAVPGSQREAMLALGATRWEATWNVVVPAARAGIVGAVLLALGRAVGETMAVQMVIGNNIQQFGLSLLNPATTMPAMLVSQFSEATSELNKAALIEVALILMIITFALNGAARGLVWSMTRKYGV